MVRKLAVAEPTIGNWAALDEVMVNQYYEGTFEPTVAIMDWPVEPSSISIGIHEDGDMVDADLAREQGFHVGRRYGYGGSVGVYGPNIPLFTLWFDASDRDMSLDALSRTSGEAIVEALEAYGVDAVYDHIGDVKYVVDGTQYKAVANAPVRLHDTDLWAVTTSIIWGGLPEGLQDILDEAVRVPPEKFEDKDAKTVTGRMKPLSLEFDRFGTDVSKRAFIDELIEQTVGAVFGDNEPIEEDPDVEAELEEVERLTPFFESDTWIDRRATSRMCRRWDGDDTVGVASFKSRKLIKASLILDGTTIEDALITGDFFIRPHPTVTREGAPAALDEALAGVDATDEDAVLDAVTSVLGRPNAEMPMVDSADVVQTVQHAADNTMTVDEYLAEHA